ncbi:MAG TPA: response regulator [Phycisphaerae bacterium]|jgi:two-component system chemotaxis response regulator CheY|nr:response regulator [Phycisphaerae bacterium]
MKFLLVDDSKAVRCIEKKILADLPGIEFVEAANGVEALAQIAATPGGFAMMIVDWNMPQMDGITLIRKVRETDKKTLMIMATTEAEKVRVLDAIRAGVNNYCVKPFSPESLMEKVKQTLEKAATACAA